MFHQNSAQERQQPGSWLGKTRCAVSLRGTSDPASQMPHDLPTRSFAMLPQFHGA